MKLSITASDRELVQKIVEGNEKAFSILFFKYLQPLQAFAVKFTKSEIAAEEIIQDSFLRVWISRDKLDEVENVKAYLYKYVANECLSHLRKKLREEKLIHSLTSIQKDSDNTTIEQIHLNEVTKIIETAVEKLPAQRKKIYHLSRSDGKTIPEIAEILQVSPNTVKNSLVISLKFIRGQLGKFGIMVYCISFLWFLY